jgi:hypothetical protein
VIGVEFMQENHDDGIVNNLFIQDSLAGDLLRVEVSMTDDGEMTVQVFNMMNEGEGVFVNQFPLGG